MATKNRMNPEGLPQWYLRLNGFFTITNFVVHPASPGSQLTDADIVGVRLPYRHEFPGGDERVFSRVDDRPYVVLAEVKRTRCKLNQSWQSPPHKAVAMLLRDLGPFPKRLVRQATDSLVRTGCYESDSIYASLFFAASKFDRSLPPKAPTRSWREIIKFIHTRFTKFDRVKTDHQQWDSAGRELWKHFRRKGKSEDFVQRVGTTFQVPVE